MANFKFSCEYCNYDTDRLYNLRRHITIKHPGCKDFTESPKCSLCGIECDSGKARWMHQQKCGHKPPATVKERNLPVAHPPGTVLIQNNYNYNYNNNIVINMINVNTQEIEHQLKLPMPFLIHRDTEQIPEFDTDHISKFQNNGLEGVLKEIVRNPYNMPLRKMETYGPYLEVHMGDNNWSREKVKDITPLFLYHSLSAVRDLDAMNKCLIIQEQCDKIIEALEIKIDPKEYWSEHDHSLYKKSKSDLMNLMGTLRLMAIKNGDRYKALPPNITS